MAHSIYHLIYTSQASFPFRQPDLTELLKQSRQYNAEQGITGLLLYAEGNFMQLLEGPKEKIETLMTRIAQDSRHQNVSIPEEGPVAQRQFLDWSMAFLDFSSPHVRSLPGYSTFLEIPVQLGDITGSSMRSMHLLHYFKAVMTVSNESILKLAETLDDKVINLSSTEV